MNDNIATAPSKAYYARLEKIQDQGMLVEGTNSVRVDRAPYSDTRYNATINEHLIASIEFDFDQDERQLKVVYFDQDVMQTVLETQGVFNELHALGLIIAQCGTLACELTA